MRGGLELQREGGGQIAQQRQPVEIDFMSMPAPFYPRRSATHGGAGCLGSKTKK